MRLGKVKDVGQVLPAKPSLRVDGEALSGQMERVGRFEVGLEDPGAGLAGADRHVRELAGLFRNLHTGSATRRQRRRQTMPPSLAALSRTRALFLAAHGARF